MKLNFALNTRRNMFAGVLNSTLRLVFPFLNRTLFLWLLGPEFLGLNGLFTSILGVLMLAELGFGMAVICSMYKPVAEDDTELICAYLKFYRTVYRWVGAAIFVIGLCLLPFLRNLVHGDVPPAVDLHILYLVHLVNTSLSYFLFAYRGSVLGAYGRKDVIVNISSGVMVMQYVTVFLILLLTRNYYCYVIATVAFTVLQNIAIAGESHRLFPDIKPRGKLPPERRRAVISDVKSIFLHKIGGVISYSSDNLVIAAFLGLVAVAAYGNYYYVVNAVGGFVAAVYSSMLGGFGNKIHTESKDANFELFMKISRMMAMVLIWCSAMMAALYQPFMAVWTGGKPEFVRHLATPVLMVVYFYIVQSRQLLLTFKSAAALWREDRWKPIVAGVVNLSLNITLILTLPEEYKLDGVIFSTIVAFAFIEAPWESHIVFTRHFTSGHAKRYWRFHLGAALFAVALCLLTAYAAACVPVEGVWGLVLKGAAAAAVATAGLVAVFRSSIPELVKAVRKR